jgi:hypothetical protein
MVFSGLLRRVALVRTDVSEEPGASFIRVFLHSVRRLLVAACVIPSSPIFVTLPLPHGVTTQKTPFFIVTAMKTSNLTMSVLLNKL